MRGNTFGRFLTLTTFGESHGVALGAVVDGCPAGIPLVREDFSNALARRRPGQSEITTSRAETDEPEILSGLFEGKTLGTPIAVIVRNHDADSSAYHSDDVRSGHADEVWQAKFGRRDWRGGGRSSGRETVARVIGGVVAEKILSSEVRVVGFTRSVGSRVAEGIPIELTRSSVDRHVTRCPDSKTAQAILEELRRCKETGDSMGGVAEIRIDGVTAGWGEPVFRKIKSELAAALMSVGGVSGVEVGAGFASASKLGSEFHSQSAGTGGILGGISTGDRIVLRAAFKPTSTIGKKAREGRHDPCIVPRAIPVLEAMVSLVLADLYLESKLNRVDRL